MSELFEAVVAGDVSKAKSLVQGGANVNEADAEGVTPLMRAAGIGNVEMVNALVTAGADVKAVDQKGWTPLFFALYNDEKDCGFPEVVQALVDAGADVEAQIVYGVRPLMIAAGYGEAAVVEVLLNAGADPKARNEGDRTALMMVKDKDYVDVINMLHEAEMVVGEEEGCGSRNAPSAQVVTFMKPEKH